jgi:hypothetical protein
VVTMSGSRAQQRGGVLIVSAPAVHGRRVEHLC